MKNLFLPEEGRVASGTTSDHADDAADTISDVGVRVAEGSEDIPLAVIGETTPVLRLVEGFRQGSDKFCGNDYGGLQKSSANAQKLSEAEVSPGASLEKNKRWLLGASAATKECTRYNGLPGITPKATRMQNFIASIVNAVASTTNLENARRHRHRVRVRTLSLFAIDTRVLQLRNILTFSWSHIKNDMELGLGALDSPEPTTTNMMIYGQNLCAISPPRNTLASFDLYVLCFFLTS
ncbi:hypothetical protein C8J55DRAFT_491567 [Lentinula edodes]|uniref:Uncharacterized protein n=1 Tax=Lentinula lateritia TaxID=40482 RepID=A0A9W9DIG4_9AGAR|nr:hypothetical protein C8J55DRAFT_491567 [Lentinula edodes]